MLKNNVKINKIMQYDSIKDNNVQYKNMQSKNIQDKKIQNKKGISLIALVITIIVIIILAAIVMVSGSGQVDKATFAKFEQEFSDFDTVVRLAVVTNKTNHAVKGDVVSDKQAIYEVASNKKIDDEEEIVVAGKVADLNNFFDIMPEEIEGDEVYEIIDKNTIEGYRKQENFYSSKEKLYVTDAGEVFTLPGFPLNEDGVERKYLNARKYYTGEKGEETITFRIEKGEAYDTCEPELKKLWDKGLGSYTVPKGMTWQDFIDSEYNPIIDENGTKLFGTESYSNFVCIFVSGQYYEDNYFSFKEDYYEWVGLNKEIKDGDVYGINHIKWVE